MNASLTHTFWVQQSPDEAFAAINNVRGWWSGNLDGSTDRLGAEFSYEVPGLHYSAFRITEFVPAEKVSWLVTDSRLTFVADEEEWTGTTVVFDLFERDGGTQVTFTHEGLVPQYECFDVCNQAWSGYITGSLRNLIVTGAGEPNSIEGEEALAQMQATASES